MDLKRAWRNGFLASVIFAIPLSDLYNNQYSNLIADDSAQKAPVQHAPKCETDTSCEGLAETANDDISGATTSWDNNIDENGRTIPGNAVTELLLGSGDADFSDIQKKAIQIDPQDLFQPGAIGESDLDTFGSAPQNRDGDFDSLVSLYYGFGNPASAPSFSGPFMPSMFAPGGKTTSADLRHASASDSETPFVDPLSESSTPIETAGSGTGGESLHLVPEPSSFVLITIGTISVASLLYRKSKLPTRLS